MNKPPLEPLPIAEQSNFRHELWLIYSQLRDAENDPVKRLTILERSRQELGMVLNEMNRPSTNFLNPTNHQPKSPRSQAANLNCRYRQKDLTPDRHLELVWSSLNTISVLAKNLCDKAPCLTVLRLPD